MIYKEDESTQTNPVVALVGNFSHFGLELFLQLEKKYCRPFIITEDNSWQNTFNKIGLNTSYILKTESFRSKIIPDYVLCINSSEIYASDNSFTAVNTKTALKISGEYSAKSLYIFDYFLKPNVLKEIRLLRDEIINNKEIYAGVIFIGDYLTHSDKNKIFSDHITSNFLRIDYDKNEIEILNKEPLSVINFDLLISQIIRQLFSLKAYKTSTVILSKPTALSELSVAIKEHIPNITINSENSNLLPIDAKDRIYLDPTTNKEMAALIKTTIDENIKSHLSNEPEKHEISANRISENSTRVIELKKITYPKYEKKVKVKRYLKIRDLFRRTHFFINSKVPKIKLSFHLYKLRLASFLVGLLFVFPLVLIFFSVLLFNIGKLLFNRVNPAITDKIFGGSLVSSVVVKAYSNYPSRLPVVGFYFKEMQGSAEVLEKLNNLNMRTLSVTNNLFSLTKDFIIKGKYNQDTLQSAYVELDYIYNQTGFLEAELKNGILSTKIIGRLTSDERDLSKQRIYIGKMKQLIEITPELLGKNRPVNYLVLFQNNRILRPTGGEIARFGLATFTNGELVDYQTYSSDEINSTLQGTIVPPNPLKKYFNASSWFISDVNWDPDFPTTAAKAEWFIDKAFDKPVDGVIAINSKFWSDMEAVNLQDKKNEDSVSANSASMNNNANSDMENFLVNFSKKSFDSNFVNLLNYSSNVSDAFKTKDVQIFLNDDKALRLLSDNNMDGSLERQDCLGNCYSDFMSVVEYASADTGSQNVIRQASLNISLEEKLVKRRLVYFIDNTSQDTFKTYLRVIVPTGIGFSPVKVVKKESSQEIIPDVSGYRGFKEAGLYIEVKPKETVALMYTWENGTDYSFEKDGEYWLSWRAQSGMDNLPVDIKIEKPDNIKLSAQPGFSLTEDNLLGYNTNLSRDFFSRIFWNR